jgi:hypothetical protein
MLAAGQKSPQCSASAAKRAGVRAALPVEIYQLQSQTKCRKMLSDTSMNACATLTEPLDTASHLSEGRILLLDLVTCVPDPSVNSRPSSAEGLICAGPLAII